MSNSHPGATAPPTEASEQRVHLPRWYAVASTALLILGVAVLAVGAVAGWFLPVLGAALLGLNVLTFPGLLAMWQVRGVVPLNGLIARSRFWRVAPVAVPVALVLGLMALSMWPEHRVWVLVGIAVPFLAEHIVRLSAWWMPR